VLGLVIGVIGVVRDVEVNGVRVVVMSCSWGDLLLDPSSTAAICLCVCCYDVGLCVCDW
jgi:hypothetical protein